MNWADMPTPQIDLAAKLYGSDKLTRRFVSTLSRWEVEWYERWDGTRRLCMRLGAARPASKPTVDNCPNFYTLHAVDGCVDLVSSQDMLAIWRTEAQAVIAERIFREAREMDASMAAYCASNLWC